jgi:hypothetical protein
MDTNTLTPKQKLQYTYMWCNQIGIKPSDLGCGITRREDGKIIDNGNAHPAIDDVILMIHIRTEFWSCFSNKEKGIWAAYWNQVYHKGFHLKAKAMKKVEALVTTGIYRQQVKQQQIQTIKQQREHLKKYGTHMTAKSSIVDTTVSISS